MFSPESNVQLEVCGHGIYNVVAGVADGVGAGDISTALAQVGLTQACVDEIRADKPKAIAAILGAALTKFSQT